ncbi:PglL family O-oligosaccharyltransferase [Pseudomonas sp. AG1028]|uniref:PglL family O-oligosaccharyltransferase n=1 Tax=Pseudomonas sp. AG1028 TaxID=2572911 RepID=UPI0011BDA5A0|nr:O-antigen ligase family protein [Pseudomonas sp. AG1028]
MHDLIRTPRVIPFFLLLISWLLPNHVPPFNTAYQDFSAVSAVLLLWILFPISIRLDWRILILVFFAFLPVFQWWLGTIFFWGDAFLASAYLLFFLFSLSFSSGLSDRKGLREEFISRFFIFLILAAVLSIWIAARQWLLLSGSLWTADMPPGGRPFANMGQPNNLATLLVMGLFGVVYFYEKHRFSHIIFWMLVLVLLFGVALTQSRTPWLVFPVMLLYWVFKYRRDFRLTRFGFASMVGLYACMVVLLPTISSTLLLSSANPYERMQSLERLDLWWQLLHAVLNGPLWGYGWNQVSVAQAHISQAYPVSLMTEHSHNILLDILLWNGPVVGSAVILFLGGWLFQVLRRSRSIESLCSVMAASVVILHGMLEYPLEYAFLLLPVGLLLGVAVSEDSVVKTIKVPSSFQYGIVCVLAMLLFWAWSEYRVVEEEHRLMRFETAKIGSVQSNHIAPPVQLFTQLREFIRFVRTPAEPGMSEEDLIWMRKVAHRYPYPPSLFRYSLALGLNGHTDEAREQLSILRALHGEEHYMEALQSIELMGKRYPQLQYIH